MESRPLNPKAWGLSMRLAFRFAFIYFLLVIFPFPYPIYPVGNLDGLTLLWNKAVPWFGRHFLHVKTTAMALFSDDVFSYSQLAFFVVLALIATIIWSVIDWKRKNYERLHECLRIYVRLALGCVMLGYAISKIYPEQFLLSPSKLLQPLGDMSRMTLLWDFMAASRTYTIFTGLVEFLGAALLFVPRAAPLGALISAAALVNVVMLNFSYDVVVKVFSFQLLLMALFLLAPEIRPLADVIVLRRQGNPRAECPIVSKAWIRYAILALQIGFGVYAVVSTVISTGQHMKSDVIASPLAGIWRADELIVNGQTRPLLLNDEKLLTTLVFEDGPHGQEREGGDFAIHFGDGSRQLFHASYKTEQGSFSVTSVLREDCEWWIEEKFRLCTADGIFGYTRPGPDTLILDGKLNGDQIHARLHRVRPNFFLTQSRFHWTIDSSRWVHEVNH